MEHGPSKADVLSLLQGGEIRNPQMVPRSWNATFLVEVAGRPAGGCRAIYKPCRGEAPLWDFPSNTLYRREFLAYRVSEALGWGIVPLTVIRDGPYGIGTVQLFIEAQDGRHYFNLLPTHKEEMVRIALFDCLVNNADRKAGHCLVDRDGCIWAIDHGLTFLAESKLRTVMWDISDEPLPDVLKGAVAMLPRDDALREALSSNLSRSEAGAFYQRVEEVLCSSTLSMERYADPWRPYPWPMI